MCHSSLPSWRSGARPAIIAFKSTTSSNHGPSVLRLKMRDRFGAVPPAVENLLYVALVKAMARRGHADHLGTEGEET